jgi:two-component system cell cycle response regulator DivK
MTQTVLIVEDNEMNMKLFNDLLQAHDFNTIQTPSGHNALKLTLEHRPDLIIMDIQLPEISGLDVTKAIKADERVKNIPIIAVTAFAMKGDQEKILEAGCDGYISKPVSVTNFIKTISEYLP